MRLNRLFSVIAVIVVLLILVPTIQLLASQWNAYKQTKISLTALETLQKVLIVAEFVSKERGPTNAALGTNPQENGLLLERLNVSREKTNEAIDALLRNISSLAQTPNIDSAKQSLMNAQVALLSARNAIDQTLSLEYSARTADSIHSNVTAMIEVIHQLRPTVSSLSNEVLNSNPKIAKILFSISLSADLREYAGQLGSQFTVPLSKNKPLAESENRAIERLRGRINEIRSQLDMLIQYYDFNNDLHNARIAMDVRYFDQAINLIEHLTRIGQLSGNYSMSTDQFAAKYVPDMGSILAVRDKLLEIAFQSATSQHLQVGQALMVSVLLIFIVLLSLFGLFFLVWHRVLQPLNTTRDLITLMAQGNLDVSIPVLSQEDELGEILAAIASIKSYYSLQRMELEREREFLAEQLCSMSDTDGLTGLLTHRSFLKASENLINYTNRYPLQLGLIKFDIDCLKSVNDRHGHSAGDAVLLAIANYCRSVFREIDIVGRFSGQEFAVLTLNIDEKSLFEIAERARSSIEKISITIADGTAITITASFGITMYQEVDTCIDHLLERADRALYLAKISGRNQIKLMQNRDLEIA